MGRILVTGATGFVGRHLVGQLDLHGRSVCAVGSRDGIEFPRRVERVRVDDIRSPDAWQSVDFDNVDSVVHLAARAHVMSETTADPIGEFRSVNVAPSLSLFRACEAAGVRRFVFVSSIGVLGNLTSGRPFSLADVPAPVEAYAISKWEAEMALVDMAGGSRTELTILRPALVYGAGAKGNLLRLMRLVQSGWPLPLANVPNRRNLLHVASLCELIEIVLENPRAAGKTYLAADEQAVSTARLIELIADAMQCRVRMVGIPRSALMVLASLAGKGAELERLIGSLEIDSAVTCRELGWDNRKAPAEGIPPMVVSYLNDSHAVR